MTEEHKQEETKSESKGDVITIKKDNLWKYSSFFLGAIVIILAIVIISGGNSNSQGTGAAVGAPSAVPSPPVPSPSPTAKVNLDQIQHIKGDADAPVTLVEWTDYECPFCGRFYSQTYNQIVKEYVDTGKVKFGVEDFPLSFHAQAQKAAEASECAGKQDKFWEMHDLLFESGVQGGVDSFKGYAQQLGLDTSEFNKCLDSGETASGIQKDFQEGQLAGVQGTPGFAIVGADGTVTSISGAQPFAAFDAALKAAGA